MSRFAYLEALPVGGGYTYCKGKLDELNSLGYPLRCDNRIEIGEQRCAACQLKEGVEKILKGGSN